MSIKLTIIGAGPGGYVAAVRAAQRGAEVTVVEDSDVGETCLHRGCIPARTLIASAEVLERVRGAGDFGIDVVDLSKTTHIFEMTATGGIQQVEAKDPKDFEQIELIRQHLQHEAMLFKNGNFSDPASLHGAAMPGLRELSAGASKIKIEYSDIPKGGQITFTTKDIPLLTAIHRWFGAQLSEHGSDAIPR